jgi:hypothetical protein
VKESVFGVGTAITPTHAVSRMKPAIIVNEKDILLRNAPRKWRNRPLVGQLVASQQVEGNQEYMS